MLIIHTIFTKDITCGLTEDGKRIACEFPWFQPTFNHEEKLQFHIFMFSQTLS